MHKFAREAYDMGIRYIGGCCGFLPYHIRAIAEELAEERGQLPVASEKHIPWAGGLMMHTKPWVRARASREYWEKMKPAAGRPYCPSMSCPDNWGVTQGHHILKQQKEATSKEDIEVLQREQASIIRVEQMFLLHYSPRNHSALVAIPFCIRYLCYIHVTMLR